MALNNEAETNAPKRGEEWERTALLIVDMQNDFIHPGGPLHVAGGGAVVAGVKKSVSIAREKSAHVIWVVREHDVSGRDVELFRIHLYPDGQTGPTVKGTYGSQLVEGLEPKTGETILVKSRFSGFFATNLDLILRRLGIRTVVVAGVQTPNCIRATAFDALALDYHKVMVLADATAAASARVHDGKLLLDPYPNLVTGSKLAEGTFASMSHGMQIAVPVYENSKILSLPPVNRVFLCSCLGRIAFNAENGSRKLVA